MARQWYIHRDENILGPYSAEEIRTQLRQGDLDPFEFVSQGKSSVRRQLVEVDEIFAPDDEASNLASSEPTPSRTTPEAIATDPQDSRHDIAPFEVRSRADRAAHSDDEPERDQPEFPQAEPPLDATRVGAPTLSEHPPLSGHPTIQLREQPKPLEPPEDKTIIAKPDTDAPESMPPAFKAAIAKPPKLREGGKEKSSRNKKSRKSKHHEDDSNLRKVKKFYLVDDRGKTLGPQSAAEVLSLYSKGILDRKVKVFKEGTSSQVPITRFVAVYSATEKREALQDAKGSPLELSSARLQRLSVASHAQMQSRWGVLPIISLVFMITAIALAGAAGWLAMTTGPETISTDRMSAKSIGQKSSTRSRSVKEVTKPTRPSGVSTKRTAPKPKPKPKIKPKKKKPKVKPRPKPKAKPRPKPKRTVKSRPKPRIVRARPVPKPRVFPARPKPRPPPQPRVQPKPPPRPRVVAATRPPPPPKPKAPPRQSIAALQNGQQVSGLGPMSYDVNSVQSCALKCSVTFSGAGGTVVGKFFGAAYKNQLIGKGGRARISGTVQKRGTLTIILLNGVN